MIDIITNNPLISYFERLRRDYNLKTYKDIAQYLDISIGTVKNAYGFRTIFPSKRLTDHLSTHLNKKPEIVLTDIYKESFIEPCNEYIKIVIFSLTYHYGYNLFLEPTGYIRSLAAWLPFVQKDIQIYAPIRKNGHETKFTGILDFSKIRKTICDLYISGGYEYDSNYPFKPFNNKQIFSLTIASCLYTFLNDSDLSEYRRLIIVFNSNYPDEVVIYNEFRNSLDDQKKHIIPLLYDESAEHFIRDTDQI